MDRTGAQAPRGTPPDAAGNELVHARQVRATGAVQGVGFRPFVHGLATALGLAGHVRNDSEGVDILVEGPLSSLELFLARLVDDAPPLALVERVVVMAAEPTGAADFTIVHSESGPRPNTLVTADAATCRDCSRELLDPRDRRHRYPFINCTNCGPRFTIITSVPYDRPHTTMAGFEMCPACRAEYDDPGDRRFHAQPNACSECGPRLSFRATGDPVPAAYGGDALAQAVAVLRDGGIVAVKGLGGYHLACDATNEASVQTLRRRKHRDERPFAVMAAGVDDVARYCVVTPADEALLASSRRPVVLLERLAPFLDASPHLAPTVAPDVTTYGLFLPYTPLHQLLLHDVGRPLVMTSGNVSDEPIAFRDDDAHSRLTPLADAFLGHDRPIHMRTDDSVARTFRGEHYLLRRARGWAPLPVTFSGADHGILAVGGHLKNTFALTRRDHAFVSHHIGDLENLETLRSLEQGVAHFQRLFALDPRVVTHDLHPDYLSTRFARSFAEERGLPTVAVQHHEAHIASVLADAGHSGPVVGVAFDGAGYGPDGTIWGGELFVGSPGNFERVAHLDRLAMPGGETAVREPWRLALSLLEHCGMAPEPGQETLPPHLQVLPGAAGILSRPWRLVLRALRSGVNAPPTSSAGRLFDAVSSLLGLRYEAGYEGQAAIALETAARRHYASAGLPEPDEAPGWIVHLAEPPVSPGTVTPSVLPIAPIGHAVVVDAVAGLPTPAIAARFHHALAWITAAAAERAATAHGLDTVALSGGVFQNMLLLELLATQLEYRGLRVLVHRKVPTNDGGLCLGQAETAAALLRSGRLAPGAPR
ncbi:MAG: carbamoyltransferase HypF [Thermoleophilia bacterium]